MMASQFHGTEQEAVDMLKALEANTDSAVERAKFMSDQRFIDGLLTYRHISGRLIAEEWKDKPDANN